MNRWSRWGKGERVHVLGKRSGRQGRGRGRPTSTVRCISKARQCRKLGKVSRRSAERSHTAQIYPPHTCRRPFTHHSLSRSRRPGPSRGKYWADHSHDRRSPPCFALASLGAPQEAGKGKQEAMYQNRSRAQFQSRLGKAAVFPGRITQPQPLLSTNPISQTKTIPATPRGPKPPTHNTMQ
ncbi:hypothetical protein BT67DRAFT_255881 [Trichocladium antarcticum]|uniref:Uncharacterized protein n=1 Tax=Trichocladium antarcticum TaxID=1450529 RepID=A0AAN6UMW4_9PEZI|nr:hypothetical protein BT67DRAFT_255881 [Trichocladium antarcticum]